MNEHELLYKGNNFALFKRDGFILEFTPDFDDANWVTFNKDEKFAIIEELKEIIHQLETS